MKGVRLSVGHGPCEHSGNSEPETVLVIKIIHNAFLVALHMTSTNNEILQQFGIGSPQCSHTVNSSLIPNSEKFDAKNPASLFESQQLATEIIVFIVGTFQIPNNVPSLTIHAMWLYI